jgi:hypothetical protein
VPQPRGEDDGGARDERHENPHHECVVPAMVRGLWELLNHDRYLLVRVHRLDNRLARPADVEDYLRERMREAVRRELARRGIDRPPDWR